MKRTYEQSLTFFERKTDSRGYGRELYQTPEDIIVKIVESLLLEYPELKNKTWVDPCAGDGRWQKIIERYGINCISYDIEPLGDFVIKQDFYEYNTDEDVFIIGNPPFKQLSKFVDKALSITDCCYFLGGGRLITGKLADKVTLLHRFSGAEGNQKDNRSKLKFLDTLGENVLVWCCGALFNRQVNKSFDRDVKLSDGSFAVSVHCYVKEDDRVREIK